MSAELNRGLNSLSDSARKQITASDEELKRLRHNAALPNSAWVELEDTVYESKERQLRIINDLRGAGLTSGASIYAKDLTWEKIDHQGEATVSMSPQTRDDQSSFDYDRDGVPLPIIQDNFTLGMRDRPVAEQHLGEDIDTVGIDVASRHVAEKARDLVVNGWERTFGGDGYSLYGLTNHPDANTGTLADWPNATSEIRSDIRAMGNHIKDNQFMPGGTGYWLYLSRDYYEHLNDADPEGSGDMYVRDRVDDLSFISDIRVSDFLPSGSALMFRPTRDVIDLAYAREMQTVQWESLSGFSEHFMVMMCMTPRIKSTKRGQSGIAYYESSA